jgi:hypothetical protein
MFISVWLLFLVTNLIKWVLTKFKESKLFRNKSFKPVVFAVTFVLFYESVSAHSGFDWHSVSNSGQKIQFFSVFVGNSWSFQPRIS